MYIKTHEEGKFSKTTISPGDKGMGLLTAALSLALPMHAEIIRYSGRLLGRPI